MTTSGVQNETLSLTHINSIVTLLSLLSAQYHTRSLTIVTHMEAYSYIRLQKVASKHQLETNYDVEGKLLKAKEKGGYLILNNDENIVKMIKAKPKFIALVYLTKEQNPTVPLQLQNLVTPPHTSLFIAQLYAGCEPFEKTTTCSVSGKCFRLYKPLPSFPFKVFPMLVYNNATEEDFSWNWEPSTNWLSFKKNVRDLSGTTVSVAIASHRDKETAMQVFLEGKNSFYWRMLEEHLKFKVKILYEFVSPEFVKSITRVYVKLLMTSADGLGVLPVMTSDRTQFLEYVVTGLDSKYQLMVRSPHFVHSWQYIFKPFTYESWICLGITILLISITLCFVTYKRKEKRIKSSCCFLTIFGFVCNQGSANVPKSMSARLVCYTGLIFSFSMYQFYTSNFYSLLSTKEVALPFTSLEQFLTKKTHSLYVHPDTAIYSQIIKAKEGTFRRLWEEVLQKDPMHQLNSNTRGVALQRVCNGKGALLGLPFQTMSMKELTCEIVAVNTGYFPTNVVIIIKRGFPFKSQFKFVLLRLLEGGISHKFKKEHLDLAKEKETKKNVTNEPVSLEHVAFLFAFYAASIVFSFLVLGLEIISAKSFLGRRVAPTKNKKKAV